MRVALAILAVLLLAAPVAASEREVDYIEGLVSDASTAYFIDDDIPAYEAALAELMDTSVDPATSPECRLYADLAVTMYQIVTLYRERPDSAVLRGIGDMLASNVGPIRNDCLLAI